MDRYAKVFDKPVTVLEGEHLCIVASQKHLAYHLIEEFGADNVLKLSYRRSIVLADMSQLSQLQNDGKIESFRAIPPEFKYNLDELFKHDFKAKEPIQLLLLHLDGKERPYVGKKFETEVQIYQVIREVSAREDVVWIESMPRLKKLSIYSDKVIGAPVVAGKQYTGNGEIITVSDTGLDVDHCAFRDDLHSTQYFQYTGSPLDLPLISQHHSIHSYISIRETVGPFIVETDTTDEDQGHGTHVCSIINAKCESKSDYQGNSPDAQIIMVDLADVTGNLFVPTNFYGLLDSVYKAGSRIFSASWGSETTYSGFDEEIDRFLYEHEDFVFVVAAGNDGRYGSYGIR